MPGLSAIPAAKLPRTVLTGLFPDGPFGITARRLRDAIFSMATSAIDTISAAYTVQPTDEYVRVNAAAGALTITLAASATNVGSSVTIKKVDATTSTVTVACVGADLIDGQATYTMSAPYQAITLISTGGGYDVTATVLGPAIAA
jgi:hypothetical protein